MDIPRDRTNYKIGGRLALLRKEKGLSQPEFGKEFALFCGQSRPVNIPTISSWEQDHRCPTMSTLVQLSLYYNVSCDYLFGLTDDRQGQNNVAASSENTFKLQSKDVPIKWSHLVDYDGAPVFVRFKNAEHLDQWGVLNYNEKVVRCKDFDISISVKLDIYPAAEIPTAKTQITYLEQLMTTNIVLIQVKTPDPAVQEYYNGRYQHNASHTFLVKIDSGIPLTYSGLGVWYTAFRG